MKGKVLLVLFMFLISAVSVSAITWRHDSADTMVLDDDGNLEIASNMTADNFFGIVNSSNFWDELDTINTTQMEDNSGTLNIKESWFITLWNTIFGTKDTDDLTEGSVNLYDNQSWNESGANELYVNVAGDTMTGDLSMGDNNISDLLRLNFNITGCEEDEDEGTVCWNQDDHTLNIVTGLSNVVQVGQETWGIGINKAGRDLPDGTITALIGAQGDRPIFTAADGTNLSLTSFIGVLTSDCADNAECPVTLFGQVRNIDTSSFSIGDKLYIDPTEPGNFTNVIPTLPNLPTWIATVVVSHANVGSILVAPQIDPADGFLINDIYVTNNIDVMNNITASNFIGGNGSFDNIYNRSEVDELVGGVNLDLLLHNTSSGISTYLDMNTTNSRPKNITSVIISVDETLLGAYISPNASELGITTLADGIVGGHFHGNVDTITGVKLVSGFFKVYVRNSNGTEVLLSTSELTPIRATAETEYETHANILEEVSLEDDDRILIKLFANFSGGGGGNPEFFFYVDGNTAARLEISTTGVNFATKKDLEDYSTTIEMNTAISNANTTMKDYVDSNFILQSLEGDLNVNSSDNWDNLDTFNDTQMSNNGSILSIDESWFTTLWNKIFGTKDTDDLTEGSINLYDNQSWDEPRGNILYAEIGEPLWTANQSNYFTKSEIVGFGHYNSSDFSIGDYSTTTQMNTAISNANTTMKDYVDANFYLASNPSGFTTNLGTVTNIATGDGLTGGAITTTGTISTSAITAGASQYSYWDGDSWEVRNDDDTTYSSGGTLLDLTGTTFSVNEGTLTDGKGCKFTSASGLVCDQDYLISFTESDPLWTANQSSYFTKSDILGFGYYNFTDFNIDDYYLKPSGTPTILGKDAGVSSSAASATMIGFESGKQSTGDHVTLIGHLSGFQSNGDFITGVGEASIDRSTGERVTGVGYASGAFNEGDRSSFLGYRAGNFNEGDYTTGVGYSSTAYNTGNNVTALGYASGWNNTGHDSVFIGYKAGFENSDSNVFILKQQTINEVPLIFGNFSSGDIGIGTTTPQNKLNVIGGINATANSYFEENVTVDKLVFEDDTNHFIESNSTCIIIRGDTSILQVC